MRGKETMNEKNSSLGGEGGAKMADITEMEICRAGEIINMGLKGEGATEDDSQTQPGEVGKRSSYQCQGKNC